MDRTTNLPSTRLALPPPPKFSTPQKRPRPPLPFDGDEEDFSKDQNNAKVPQPDSQLSIAKSQIPNSQINHLHRARLRLLMARRAAPPKRKRSPLPTKPPSSSPPTAPLQPTKLLQKVHSDPSRGTNGRILPPLRPSAPQSLWNRLAHAQATLAAQPRPDPRFISGRRPLDCVPGLRVSIAVTLFADGYARHDWTPNTADNSAAPVAATNGDNAAAPLENAVVSKPGATSPGKLAIPTPPAKSTNVATLPRYPYDRASRDFLKALDLGIIPPPDDLPEPHLCYYYDGCLIAEVTDLRDIPPGGTIKPRPGACSRVLLRPEMSSVYHDVACFTRHVDATVALLAEQKIIAAIAGPVDCDPRPKLPCSLQQGNLHTNTDVINIARRPKRRRVDRPPGPPNTPLLSTAALLLVDSTEKHQTMLRNALVGMRAAATESSASPKLGITTGAAASSGAGFMGRSSGEGSVSSEVRHGIGKAGGAANSIPPQNSKHGILKPPKSILELHKDKDGASGSARGSVSRAAHTTPSPRHQDRIRSVRLILPDPKAKIALQQAQAASEANASGDNAERAQLAAKQAIAAMSKNGRQLYVLELIRTRGRGVEIAVFRGVSGDKSNDVFRIQMGSEEEGHDFLKQFKVISKKEGFHLLQDVRADQMARQKQQQARAAFQQRQSPVSTGRQLGATQSQSNTQNAAAQAKMTPTRQLSQPHLHSSAQQLLQLPKQKQLQLQRQQQLRQRQQAQAQNSTQPGQQHVTQLHQTAHHQPVQHAPQLSIPQAGQAQLAQTQHQQHMTLQQQQLLQQKLQHQHQQHMQIQHHQNLQRARRLQQQFQRHDKGNVSLQQSAAMLASNGRGGQIASKGSGAVPVNMPVPRAPGATSSMSNMGSAAVMGHNQVFPPSHMQQFQQIRTQQLRAEHQRNMMAAVGAAGGDPATRFPRNGNMAGNPVAAQHMQTQAIAGLIGSAAMASGNARTGGAPNLTGADALTHQRLQQHFKQQRENVEAQTRTGKR